MSGKVRSERAPWGDFPDVIRNGDLGSLDSQPEYKAAKAGDAQAALALVDRLITRETIERIKAQIGEKKPVIVPVLAAEAAGNNKIPAMMAAVLADRLGLDVEKGIVQREKVGRTGAGSDYRLAFNPTFSGDVKRGQNYLIVDDTLTMGGTLASLRAYIENRGGHVMAASVMTAHPGAIRLPVKPSMLAAIQAKHGPAMNKFWTEEFGYGIDQLTQGEAGHLKAAKSVDAIRDRIASARDEAGHRVGTGRVEATKTGGRESALRPGAGQGLQSTAEELEREQTALIEGAAVEQTYQQTLAHYVQAKHEQVERVEDRLEGMVNRQEARLQQLQAKAPGRLALPGTRAAWQRQEMVQRTRLNTLKARLETVREIRDGMGIHSPKVEELATRRMRAENPQLASDWDAMREAMRRKQAEERKREQVKKQEHERERGRSQRLGLGKGLQ